MNILILFSLYLLSPNFSHADEGTLWRDSDIIKSDLTESQWVMFLGAEIMRLNPIPTFDLTRRDLNARTETLYGPAIGFARKWYIAGNLTTTTEPMFYYLQNNDTAVQVPSNETIASYQVSQFKERYEYYGVRIAQSLGYTFEFESLNFEPFIQAYIGQGLNRTSIHYHWDTRIAAEHEDYNSTINENITHQGLSAGMQFIGLNGYMSFIKVSKNVLTFKKRRTRTSQSSAGTSTYSESTTNLSDDVDKLSVTLGLGYIF